MNYKVFIRPEAEVDIEHALSWYNLQNKKLSTQFLDEVEKVLRTLAENPFLFVTIHKSIKRALLKRFPYGIYYIIEDSSVIVFAILHGRSNPKRWIKRIN